MTLIIYNLRLHIMAKVDKILPKLSQTGGFVGLALTKCVSLLTNCLLRYCQVLCRDTNLFFRQIWVCGYSNADFDLITVVAQNPYLCMYTLKVRDD